MQKSVLMPRYYFSVWLYTYESFTKHPEWVIDFVESTFHLANPFTLDLQLSGEIKPGHKHFRRKFNSKTWEWCKAQLKLDGFYYALTFEEAFAAPAQLLSRWRIGTPTLPELQGKPSLHTKFIPFWKLPVPSELFFVLELPFAMEHPSPALQSHLVTLARTTFLRTRASYGFVNWSQRPDSTDYSATEYERKSNVSGNETTRLCYERIRGAFWENYITKRHIERLGGVQAIMNRAPCARIDELIKGKAIALRITEEVNELTPALVESLENYLQPLRLTRKEIDDWTVSESTARTKTLPSKGLESPLRPRKGSTVALSENTISMSSERFARVEIGLLEGTSKIRNYSESNEQTSVGDFLSRLWALFGAPEILVFEGFAYVFRDKETGLIFSAFSAGSGPAYGGFESNEEYLLPILEEFDALLATAVPADCQIEIDTDFGIYQLGAQNGIPFYNLIEYDQSAE